MPTLARLTLLLAVAAAVTAAQGIAHYPTPAQPAGQPRLEFTVVSVLPSAPNQRGGIVRPMPADQGYTCDNVPLLTDMTIAYGVPTRQIQGGPDWIRGDRWDIEGKADAPQDIDTLHIMLEHALEDRFALKLHPEVRQENVLSLEVDKSGAKLKPHEPANDPDTAPFSMRRGSSDPNTATLTGTNITMSYLAQFLNQAQTTPVLDHTALDGHYDITVSFSLPRPVEGAGPAGPPDLSPLFEALSSQLGLHIVRDGKGPVTYLVIDSVQKPTAN